MSKAALLAGGGATYFIHACSPSRLNGSSSAYALSMCVKCSLVAVQPIDFIFPCKKQLFGYNLTLTCEIVGKVLPCMKPAVELLKGLEE